MAVAEFLENVGVGALGLGESDKVLSMVDLTPIPIGQPEPTPLSGEQLRGRGGVDAIATANKGADALWWPALGPGRRDAGFSIAGLTAVAGTGKLKSQAEEGQREILEVSSRAPSLRSHRQHDEGQGTGSSGEESVEDSVVDEGDEEDGVAEHDEGEEEVRDTRSIKSFESSLTNGWTRRKTDAAASTSRKPLTDLTDRLTHGMASMSRRLQDGDSAHKAMPLTWRLRPPNRRFSECTEQDIRVSEVGELLCECQRLVEAVRHAGGFQE